MDKILPQPMQRFRRHGGQTAESRVGQVVAGQEGDRDTGGLAGGGDFVDPIGPIGATAEQPHDHQLRPAHDAVDINVDRHVVAQLQEVRQPQARPAGPSRLRFGQTGDVGIRRRQHHDVARRLA